VRRPKDESPAPRLDLRHHYFGIMAKAIVAMGNYDFTGLSPHSFESLAQALAVKVLGAGTIVFGAGPDGGREATFDGLLNYPAKGAAPWKGYVVLQAKFRQRLTDRETDAEWATKQLRAELDKYVERKGGRRPPDYYIFVTNVVLTPVQDAGGKDLVAKVFEEYADRLPLRGWSIWDYDQLSTFIDAEESVRHAFTAFITSGDVLAMVMKRLQTTQPDFEEVMTSYLARELNGAKYADLEQTSASRILLSRVFVDLPVSDQRLAEPPEEAEEEEPGVVATLLDAARERLGRTSRTERSATGEPGPAARFVVVGGPGQGKTTVGQFACQLFRAAILVDRPRHHLAEEVLLALDETVAISKREAIELPRARRFPLHVVLRDYASALSRRRKAIDDGRPLAELTLFSYLVDRICGRTNREVKAEDFRAWLRAYPWFVVLDGLDEVPSSSNRAEVLQSIEEFWMEVAQANADLLMVATTRPQDYQDDFSPAYYQHRWLVPLSPDRALRYGKRLLEMRHGEESDRAAELIARMGKAAESEATARLMRTPLQITIMSTLVEQVGKPPQDRWRLFREYYNAIYRRERERSSSELLGAHESDINAIHHRTGLELQILSESSGRTDAKLSKQHFESIVRQRLEEQGHEGAALERLLREIIDAAALRLVFIVGLDVDSVGFEIRSLQEFMAAEALLGGSASTEIMQRRLRAIASAPSWRNVFIFAAGRCFAETESLIDTIHLICHELNTEASEASRAIQAGSLLALELLEDAAVGPKPKHARLLARTALELLDAPPSDVHVRLAAAHNEAVDGVFREEIDARLKGKESTEQLGTWRTLLGLMDRGAGWPSDVAAAEWPHEAANALKIVSAMGAVAQEWTWKQAKNAIPCVDYSTAANAVTDLERPEDWFEIAFEVGVTKMTIQANTLQLRLVSIHALEDADWGDICAWKDVHPTWIPLVALAQSNGILDAHQIADILEELAGYPLESYGDAAWNLPWPLRAMLLDATRDVLRERSARLRSGEFGDREEWIGAEERWQRQGVVLDELDGMDLPWPTNIVHRGFPYRAAFPTYFGLDEPQGAKELANCFMKTADASLKQRVAGWLLHSVRHREASAAKAQIPLEVFTEALKVTGGWATPKLVQLVGDDRTENAFQFLEGLGEHRTLWLSSMDDASFDAAISMIQRYPHSGGLARLVSYGLRRESVSVDRDRLPPIAPDQFDLPRLRSAAAMLNVVSGHYTDANAVARVIAEFPEEAEHLASLLMPPYRNADETLLVALGRALPNTEWRARGAVRDALTNLLKSKSGGNRGPAFWKDLVFPALAAS
jgi:hypothetical protein